MGVPVGPGRGSGAGFGGQGKRVPKVRQAKAQVKGSLHKDIIRRIVRAHINEVRSCYNATLTKDTNASGSIAIKLMIDAHGKVNESYIGRIQKGQAVTITPRSYPDLTLKGEVSTIMPAAEKETASVKVIVTFLDHDERILPNMSVDLSFNEGEPSGLSTQDLDAALAHGRGAL